MKMRRTVLLLACLWLGSAGAQGLTPDASLPDASVGGGGADHTSEEADPNEVACLTASDCDGPFACNQGRCVPVPIRNASGCGGGLGVLGLVGVAAGLWRRRR